MFKTREEILEIIESKNFENEPFYELLHNILTCEKGVTYDAVRFLSELIPEIKMKGSWEYPLKPIVEYHMLIVDLLSFFRQSYDSMQYIMEIVATVSQLAQDEPLLVDYVLLCFENLGLLFSDESCVLYDLNKGLKYLNWVYNAPSTNLEHCSLINLDNPIVLLAFGKCNQSINNNDVALYCYKTAMENGSEEAKTRFRLLCEKKKLCVYCGGKFKGIFTKKCVNCGKEKDY